MRTDEHTGRTPSLRRGLNPGGVLPSAVVFVLAGPGVARHAGQRVAVREGLTGRVR